MKSFQEFMQEVNEARSTGNAFDIGAAKERLKAKEKGEYAGNRHDIKHTETGMKVTRRFDKDDTAADAKKDASGEAPVKRGRGRPPGKYGSYKKKVKESLEIIESLDTEEEIEQFIESLDEESFEELANYLDQLDEGAQ
jgi:hypothetical protein